MTVVCLPNALAAEVFTELPSGLPSGIELIVWDGESPRPVGVERTEFFLVDLFGRSLPAETLATMPRLRVVQLVSAGFEHWVDVLAPGVTLCNASAAHSAPTAELAVAGILALRRRLPRFFDDQRAHRWDFAAGDGLEETRVLIIGAGEIGQKIAAAVEVFGASVTLVARRERAGVRRLDEVPALLPHHQVVALAVPANDETRGLVDAAFLAAMPDGAVLANVARGSIVDTDALVAALGTGRLSAFLDVTDPEPLPPEHPLWDAPNLLITPHVGGGPRGWQPRAYRLARDQAIRFHQGEPLDSVVIDGGGPGRS